MSQQLLILYNAPVHHTADELDVLAQRDLVTQAAQNLGWTVIPWPIGDDLKGDMDNLLNQHPDVVFNLVESTWGKGELIYFAPAMLKAWNLPFTGVPLEALFLTTGKVLAKRYMQLNQLPTAAFFGTDQAALLDPDTSYICKPIWEEASVGIDSEPIVKGSDQVKIGKISRLPAGTYFLEEYIDGREFNVSLLAGPDGPEVLPPAEILFGDFFASRPKIVGYKAKWDEQSEEYRQTNRAFHTLQHEPELESRILEVCRRCWEVFELRGYARVDLRVDTGDQIYILEINGNPCIAPDSGFIAAAREAGYTVDQVIKRILDDAN